MPTTIDEYLRTAEHRRIQQEIDRFIAQGGTIQIVPWGASGTDDGLYGSVGATIRKHKSNKKRLPKQDDDDGDIEY